jgi:hypothetical protein
MWHLEAVMGGEKMGRRGGNLKGGHLVLLARYYLFKGFKGHPAIGRQGSPRVVTVVRGAMSVAAGSVRAHAPLAQP